mmetsp:Transcript_13099/g.14717  ORF Transcript_13099/g.14717 Transcript_13099/m.14717 type:complete len:130 (+) Transcript_13099:1-390(+)
MTSTFFGIGTDADPKSINLSAMNITSYDKGLLKKSGFDIGTKFTKKARKGFPYEALTTDSEYFAAYKEFYNCIDEATADQKSLSEADMDSACGRQWRRVKVLGIQGQLRYTNINSPFFQPLIDLNQGTV